MQSLIGSVRRLVSYSLVRTDGVDTVTVCDDQAGINESIQTAKDWIAKNGSHLGVTAPEVSEGGVVFHMTK